MQVTDFPTLAPSCCFICRTASSQEGYVDTNHNFDPPGITELNGRKYLCTGCVRDAADALGLFDSFKEQAETFEARTKNLINALESFSDLDKLLTVVIEDRAKTIPTKKPGGKANA